MVFKSAFVNQMRIGWAPGSESDPASSCGKDLHSSFYVEEGPAQSRQDALGEAREALRKEQTELALLVLTINCCHEVIVKTDQASGHKQYNASSPDEVALLRFTSEVGMAFDGFNDETNDFVISNAIGGREDRLEKLLLFRFSSARSRMSCLVRDRRSGKHLLLAKGADHMMMARASGYSGLTKDQLSEALREYSKEGLRTLVYGYKELEEAEVHRLKEEYYALAGLVGNEKLEAVGGCKADRQALGRPGAGPHNNWVHSAGGRAAGRCARHTSGDQKSRSPRLDAHR